jgi:phosphotriesterase-related protein
MTHLVPSRALLLLLAAGLLDWLHASPAGTVSRSARADIPSLAGKILTVGGPVAPDAAGATLMHEHLFAELNLPEGDAARWRLALFDPPVSASAIGIYQHPLTLDILERVEMGFLNRDNLRLSDERTAVEEVGDFKSRGGRTIVDVTSLGLGRDPAALRRVAQATGVQIVMGASWFSKAYHPADLDRRTVESLTDEIVGDVVGRGGDAPRAGIIGEVGAQGGPLTPNEVKVIRASGRASRLTGSSLTLHVDAAAREQPAILDLLAAEGTDLRRVVVGHSTPIATDLPFMKRLLDRGAYLEFDGLGRTPRINDRNKVSDTEVGRAVVGLIRAGYLDRILLAQDVCTKVQLKAYGGGGYSFVLERFVPYLKRLGVTQTEVDAMLVENPRRVLTFAAPRAAGEGR